ncbi:MAG: exo-alpha-sialidase [Lentisphaerae bacterium]|nr:exo-alpha-sialidase [Lentisphaerota bacterium]
MSTTLTDTHRAALKRFLLALVDQSRARVLVEPNRRSAGFWFGGGNVVRDRDGVLWLCGRYRNVGDSRTGLAAGERGLECAVFASRDGGQSFQKVVRWSKADLSRPDAEVVSIEGTALHLAADGQWELFISTEKAWEYPEEVRDYRKPGCGVWSIDCLRGPSPDRLDSASLRPVLRETADAAYLHAKDPVVYGLPDGSTHLMFCSHPYCWSSANTSLAVRPAGAEGFQLVSRQLVPRGPAWDIASTRGTCRFPVPRVGLFADLAPLSILFYDGLECVRSHEENARAVCRPRGYSCEELSGAMVGFDAAFPEFERLSYLAPLFISPCGTGCSRYVDVVATPAGLLATWQQGQDDGSQPLVGHLLPSAEVQRLLS